MFDGFLYSHPFQPRPIPNVEAMYTFSSPVTMCHSWFNLILTFSVFIHASAKPNIIVFLVDDLGFADLGCFGNDTIKTPNIDRLAAEGARLRHDVTPDSICTPNRAAFLTGRYPIRSGLAAGNGERRVLVFTSASGGLPQNETTFAEIASAAGYRTGIIGKWHLGLHSSSNSDFHFHPLKQGFHHFYGLPLTNIKYCEPHGSNYLESFFPGLKPLNVLGAAVVVGITLYFAFSAGLLSKCAFVFLLINILLITFPITVFLMMMAQFNCFLMKNYEVVEQPIVLENLTMRFTDEAINFINTNKESPFLLYMSFAKVHTPLFTAQVFANHSAHGHYGDNIEEMDWSVGQILAAVEELSLKETTFVYFTSDNGPHLEEVSTSGEYHVGWSGIHRGGKGQCWDGGVRMPTIVSWPGHIQAGILLDELTSSMDVLPTIAKLTGADLPEDRVIDGKDLLPLLTNKTEESSHEFLFHYCGNQVHAVRYRPKNTDTVWKAHFMTPKWTEGTEGCVRRDIRWCHGDQVNVHDPPLLYDMTDDPAESSPIPVHMPEYKGIMKDIYPALEAHKEGIETVPYQLQVAKNFFYPSLQMCCNFPFCSCKETGREVEHYPEKV